jgi:hypothetical protein
MIPQVGIYFVVKGHVLQDSVSLDHAEPYGEALQYSGHNDYHEALCPESPAEKLFKHMPYDYFPRGRVVYFPSKKVFRLYYDTCLSKSEIQTVMEAFALCSKSVELETDEHYKCSKCNRHYLI